MTIKEKLNILEELLDIEKDSLSEEVKLDELEQWDSMAVICIVAMFDDNLGRIISPKEVKSFVTIKDITDKMK